jgi:hypothetical protein
MAFDIKQAGDWPARVIGLAVFLTGIGLLVLVFIWANRTLAAPQVNPKQINWGILGTRLAWDLGRLFLLGFLASAIAGKGAQLYAAAGRAEATRRLPLE